MQKIITVTWGTVEDDNLNRQMFTQMENGRLGKRTPLIRFINVLFRQFKVPH